MSEINQEPKRRRTEFDDALKGYYQDHDEVRPDELTDYKSLTAESVGSLILGFLSSLTIIHWIFAIFPIMGIILGVTAIRKILKASEVLGGLGISTAGVALSVIFSVIGFSCLYYTSSYATPPGYTSIDFTVLAADPRTGRLPEQVIDLAKATQTQGQRVFIEGYMLPTRKMTEIDSFVLVPALEQSKFGALTRRPTEMIEVNLTGGLEANYRTTPVRVGGVLYVNTNVPEDESSHIPPYRIDADIFR